MGKKRRGLPLSGGGIERGGGPTEFVHFKGEVSKDLKNAVFSNADRAATAARSFDDISQLLGCDKNEIVFYSVAGFSENRITCGSLVMWKGFCVMS